MAIDIKLPLINGQTEAEQIYQIKRYLYQLAEELKYNLNTLEAGTSDEASIEKTGLIDSLSKWKLGIEGEIGSIANIRQTVSSQGASISALSEWKKGAVNSIAKVDQISDADYASITGLAQYKTDTNASLVRIEGKADGNAGQLSIVTEWKGKVEKDVSSIASIEQRVKATEVTIETLTKINEGDVESLANIVSKVTANESNINALTEWKNGAVGSIASIDTLAKANQASIGLVVDNGAVKGGILIEAINNESIAKISADRLDIEGKTLNIKVDATNISGTLTANQINATNLKISAANITGTLTASQIDATELKVSAANIDGTLMADKIDVDGVLTAGQAGIRTLVTETVQTTNILAENLQVKATNIKETLTVNQVDVTGILTAGNAYISTLISDKIAAASISADQIDVTDLNSFGATIGGFTIDNNSMHTRMGTSDRILLCSGTSARYTVNGFTSTGWSILAGNNFGVLKDGTMYAANANLKGKLTTSLLDGDGKHWGATIGEGYITIDSEAFLTAWNSTDTEITYQEYLLLMFLAEDGNRWGLFAGGDYNGSAYIQPTNLFIKRLS